MLALSRHRGSSRVGERANGKVDLNEKKSHLLEDERKTRASAELIEMEKPVFCLVAHEPRQLCSD